MAIIYYGLEEVRLEFQCSVDNRELDSTTSHFTERGEVTGQATPTAPHFSIFWAPYEGHMHFFNTR